MGRPIKKSNFGNPSNPGNQIVVTADLGSGAVSAWILKQKGTRKFLITDGINTKICYLVQNISQPGEATIDVFKNLSPTEKAKTIQSKRVKTWNNNDYVWKYSAPINNIVQIDNF